MEDRVYYRYADCRFPLYTEVVRNGSLLQDSAPCSRSWGDLVPHSVYSAASYAHFAAAAALLLMATVFLVRSAKYPTNSRVGLLVVLRLHLLSSVLLTQAYDPLFSADYYPVAIRSVLVFVEVYLCLSICVTLIFIWKKALDSVTKRNMAYIPLFSLLCHIVSIGIAVAKSIPLSNRRADIIVALTCTCIIMVFSITNLFHGGIILRTLWRQRKMLETSALNKDQSKPNETNQILFLLLGSGLLGTAPPIIFLCFSSKELQRHLETVSAEQVSHFFIASCILHLTIPLSGMIILFGIAKRGRST